MKVYTVQGTSFVIEKRFTNCGKRYVRLALLDEGKYLPYLSWPILANCLSQFSKTDEVVNSCKITSEENYIQLVEKGRNLLLPYSDAIL